MFESCLISKKNPRCSHATSSVFLSLGGSHSVTWPGRRPRGYRASTAGFTFSGLPTVLCVQLGENNPGSVGAGSGARVQSAFHAPAVSATPPRALQHSAEEEELMQEEIQSMLEKDATEDAPSRGRGFLSTIFLVPKKDGGQRPVINLKSLNAFVHTEHFKMEGIHILKDLLRVGDWMVKVDLKDVYFMVPIREEDRAFLKFSFRNHTYQFMCLPFGLACAPATVWPSMRHWPSMRPLGLHQDPEANCRPVETAGSTADRIHRQYTNPGRVQGAGSGPCSKPAVSARKLGLCSEQTQVHPGTIEFLGFVQVVHGLQRRARGTSTGSSGKTWKAWETGETGETGETQETWVTQETRETGETQETQVTQETGETQETRVTQETGETGETQETRVTQETGETQETRVTQETGETEETRVTQETGETKENMKYIYVVFADLAYFVTA